MKDGCSVVQPSILRSAWNSIFNADASEDGIFMMCRAVCEFVGCDKRQRRHTMSVIRCACALLVTPYELPIVNNWPAVVFSLCVNTIYASRKLARDFFAIRRNGALDDRQNFDWN